MIKLDKLFSKFEAKMMPIATFFGTQRHFLSLRDGVVSALPFTFVGSIFFLLAKPPWTAGMSTGIGFFDSFMNAWLSFATANYAMIRAPFLSTMGIMAIYICFVISYSLATHYKRNALNFAISSTSIYLLIAAPVTTYVLLDNSKVNAMPTAYVGASGIFIAAVIAMVSVELMSFAVARGWTIKMPKGVPAVIERTFSILLPFAFAICVIYSASVACQIFTGKILPQLFNYVFTLMSFAVNNVWAVTILTAFENLLFSFGIHPTTVTGPLLDPLQIINALKNAEAYAAGASLKNLPEIWTQSFWAYYACIGGAGSTLSLCILMLKSKAKQIRAVGEISIIPSIFNINEPVIFGLPIFLNPIMVIPFMLAPTFNILLGWFCTATGIVNNMAFTVTSTTPAPLGAFIGTMDWKAIILVCVMIVVDGLIYYPFFKVEEKVQLELEKSAEKSDVTAA